MRLLVLLILALAAIGRTLPSAEAQAPAQTQKLFADLQKEKTSDRAAAQLLENAKGDPEIRSYLAAHLPELIRTSKRGEGWINAIRLSGQLKIELAAPVLANLLTNSDTMDGDGVITFHRLATLQDDPPGLALAKIGDPAVPALSELLESRDRFVRLRAVWVLINIGSPKAKMVLQQQLSAEKDPGIHSAIENSLK